MKEVVFLEKVNSELLTFHASPMLGISEFGFTSGIGDGVGADIVDCTCLGASGGASKQVRLQAADNNGNTVVFQFWFGDTRESIVDALTTQNPAEVLLYSGSSLDFTMPVSAKYIAIDYSSALSSMDPSGLYISLYIN